MRKLAAAHAGDAAGILRLRGGMDCLPVAGAMMSKEKRAAIKAYLEKQERLKKQNFDWMDGCVPKLLASCKGGSTL